MPSRIPAWLDKLQTGLLGKPDTYGGLLSDEQAAQARNSGLMNFGASLLASSGPSPMPTSLGQAFGQATLQGRSAQGQSTQDALNAALLKKQLTAPRKREVVTLGTKAYDVQTGEEIASNPAPTVVWKERPGPRGSIIRYREDTGESQQVVGPDNTQPATRQDRAPAYRDIIDPADPKRMITVDGNTYRGGSLGSPGVLGVAGKEPTAAKAEETRGTGKQAVSDQVAALRDIYNQLNEGGGIVNTDESFNAGNALQSSALGQMAGRAFGTKNQSLRNQVSQQRPLLLQAIKQATGMSAKQMDSNAELKLYLAAATDPALDYQANLAALDNIDKLFGLGEGAKETAPTNKPKESAAARAKRLGL